MRIIAASKLRVGDKFKLSSRKRNAITITKVIDLDTPENKKGKDSDIYASVYENKILLMNGCQQTILLKTEQVLLLNR